jgi:hypothetical protein
MQVLGLMALPENPYAHTGCNQLVVNRKHTFGGTRQVHSDNITVTNRQVNIDMLKKNRTLWRIFQSK